MPIDVHAHYVPSRIIATLEERAGNFGLSLVKTPPQCAIHFDYGLKVRPFFQKLIEPVDERLDGMAAQGVTSQVLSVWPDIFATGCPARPRRAGIGCSMNRSARFARSTRTGSRCSPPCRCRTRQRRRARPSLQ